MQPINYRIDIADPFAASLRGMQTGQALAGVVQQARDAPAIAEQQAAARDALMQFVQSPAPTAADYQRVILLNPAIAEQIKGGWEAMKEEQRTANFGFGAQVYSALKAGSLDLAETMLNERATAEENSGNAAGAKQFRDMARLARINPDVAVKSVGMQLAAVDPAKFGDTLGKMAEVEREEALLPGRVAEQAGKGREALTRGAMADEIVGADVAHKQGQTARLVAMTEADLARIGLERDKLQFEMEKFLEQQSNDAAAGAGFAPLSAGAEKQVFDSNAGAVAAQGAASQAAGLASRLEEAAGRNPDGFRGSVGQWFATQTGNYDSYNALRTQATGLINREVVRMLPPGPATDRDIELMQKGAPPAYAPMTELAKFARAVERTQSRLAAAQAAQASWISQNGNAGDARRDLVIGGVEVPAGTTFVEYLAARDAAQRRARR